MSVRIAPSWQQRLQAEFERTYFKKLIEFIKAENQAHIIYPPGKQIFHAFDSCSFEECRVVILGQDPYHGEGQANGLCFSVADGIKKPPSLVNIFKELHNDIGKPIPESGNLESWAKQGVLLLNSVLTVREKSPGSHANMGWETFTDRVIEIISKEKEHVVFMLWGKYAQGKGNVIDRNKHLVLESAHPSPFSARMFMGCKHFSKANAYLKEKELPTIEW